MCILCPCFLSLSVFLIIEKEEEKQGKIDQCVIEQNNENGTQGKKVIGHDANSKKDLTSGNN